MGSVLIGVEAASALTDLALHVMQAQQQVNRMIAEANANGGELTDEQIQRVQAMRHAALAALDAAVQAQQ